MSLLKENVKKLEWVLVRVKGDIVKDILKNYLKDNFEIENEEFCLSINNGADIPNVKVRFENEEINDFFQNELGFFDEELLGDAVDYDLGLEDKHCSVLPDDDKNTEYIMVELPKSILL